MKNNHKKDNAYETIEILENATIIYNNNEGKLFDAIHITSNFVFTGHILKIDKTQTNKNNNFNKIFLEDGGIPKNNIKSINGGIKRIVNKLR